MARLKDQAICIRHLDWSETSQIVVLLTREHGKLRGLAKGSKRLSPGSVARYSGGIEMLTRGEIVAVVRPSSELATLTEWDLQEPYRHLHEDLAAQRLAFFAADLAHAMLADHDPHTGAFAALAAFLESLACPDDRGEPLLRYQWALLTECGYRPELRHDVSTGEPLGDAGTLVFDARAGGLVRDLGLPTSEQDGQGPWRVRRETVDALRSVAGAAPPAAAPPPRGAIDRANRLLCVYARAILDRELPTMSVVLG